MERLSVWTREAPEPFTARRADATPDRHRLDARTLTVHAGRTAVAAATSLLVAQLFGLAEAYWAPITTLVIEQSSLGAALIPSWDRWIGTLLGAAVSAMVASQPVPRVLLFGASVFILGLLRLLTRSELTAYRFGCVTLGIVLLVPRAGSASQIAVHRFAEVSIGIGVALILALVWPERDGAQEPLQSVHGDRSLQPAGENTSDSATAGLLR
jgi:uncharacterized membrane protein YgaE (UPF0421/DUF939 family)